MPINPNTLYYDGHLGSSYPYYYGNSSETTTVTEETIEYDKNGKVVKKTTKTSTTTTQPRQFLPTWTTSGTYTSHTIGNNTDGNKKY